MSISKSVLSLAYTPMDPAVSVPAGTNAWLPTTPPSGAFRVETLGRICPSGQVVRYPTGSGGTTVIRTEYTCAVDGIPHELCCIGKLRVASAANEGGPNAPVN